MTKVIRIATCERCGASVRQETRHGLLATWAQAYDAMAATWLGRRHGTWQEVWVCEDCREEIGQQYAAWCRWDRNVGQTGDERRPLSIPDEDGTVRYRCDVCGLWVPYWPLRA